MTYVLPPLSSPKHDSLQRPEQRGKAWAWPLELVREGTKASVGCSVWGSQALKQLSPRGVLEVQTQEAKGQHQFLEANTGLKASAEAGMKWNQAGIGARSVLGVSKLECPHFPLSIGSHMALGKERGHFLLSLFHFPAPHLYSYFVWLLYVVNKVNVLHIYPLRTRWPSISWLLARLLHICN